MATRVNQGYEHLAVMREGDGVAHWGIHIRLHERFPTRGSTMTLCHQEMSLHPTTWSLGQPTYQILTVSGQEK